MALECSVSFCRENNFIKDFPQLADALMVIPLPVEEQCRGVLSEPLPNLQLLTGKSFGLSNANTHSVHLLRKFVISRDLLEVAHTEMIKPTKNEIT